MTQILRQQSIKFLLVIIAVLLAANLVVQSLSNIAVTHASDPVTAANGIPDSGAQFHAVVDAIHETNKRLDTMQAFFESGNLSVKAKIDKEDKDSK